MKIWHSILTRIPAVIVLALACTVAALYLDGWFDISFIVRGSDGASSDTVSTAGTADTDIRHPDTDTADSNTPETEPHDPDTEPADTDASETEPSDAPITADIPALGSIGSDYTLSYAEWRTDTDPHNESGAEWILADSTSLLSNLTLPDYFSSRTRKINTVSYDAPHDGSPYNIVYTAHTEDAPAVTLYMGYIIVETGTENIYNIYNADGEALGSYDAAEIAPAYCRDKKGNALFIAEFEDKNGAREVYYYLDEKLGRFVAADYNTNTDSRGVRFDYTPDYGTASESRTFAWRYIDADPEPIYIFALADAKGKALKSYNYTGAYNFSESRAAVVDEEGRLLYITRSGSTSIRASKSRREESLSRTVIDNFMPAMTDGAESIGFYYFEHGLVRARIQTLDSYRYNSRDEIYVINDKDVVITETGEQFYIPAGYDVLAYSSGMLLLSGDYGYGYMDYTGAWVVDPDLDDAAPYYEGLAVIIRDGQYALIDTDGNYIIPFGQFSYISNASTGVITAYDGEWHVLYKMCR